MDTVAGAANRRPQAGSAFSVGMEAELRFIRQFAIKLKAGLSVAKCLAALASETKHRRLRAACVAMSAQVAAGSRLSQALASQPLFDAGVVRLVELGEQTSNLKGALANAADYLERVGRLRLAMHHGVVKPLNVLTLVLLAVFIAAVSLSFLVREIFPVATSPHLGSLTSADRIAIRIAEVVRLAWPYVGVLGLLNFLALKLIPRQPKARAILEQVALRVPLVAGPTRATALACFTLTVAILMRAGALLGEAMVVAAQTATQAYMRDTILASVRKIEAGKPYLETMVEDGFLRRRDMNVVQTAERRGELAPFMMGFAGDCEREASEKIRSLTAVAHTMVVLLLGLAIAGVVLGLYVPVFVSH